MDINRHFSALQFLMGIFYCAIGRFWLSTFGQGWKFDPWGMMGGGLCISSMAIIGLDYYLSCHRFAYSRCDLALEANRK